MKTFMTAQEKLDTLFCLIKDNLELKERLESSKQAENDALKRIIDLKEKLNMSKEQLWKYF